MKTYFILPIIFVISFFHSPPAMADDDWPEIDWQKWYDERTKEYEAALLLPPDQRLEKLRPMLGLTDDLGKNPLEGLRLENYLRTQKAMLAIPGHAEYFGKKVTDAHREYKNNPHDYRHGGGSTYSNAIFYSLRSLRHLPSPETVKVLGEMLSDEWVNEADKDPYRPPSLAISAASILSKLPLKDKPYPFRGEPTTDQVAESLPHWQKWYQEVKEGHRTFSFEGDPNEYDLTGPIREAKNPDIPAATKQPAPAPQEQASDKPPTTPPSRTPWIAAVLTIITILLGWLALKTRKVI